MCGILGAFGTRLPEQSTFKTALDRLAHRGPDGEGIFATATCLLGHRRLSIIDIAGGAQPMHSHDGRYTIVFNGEIYNYKELKKELENAYPFVTNSDTEVVLAGYAAQGSGILDRLEGMFAFAIFDHQKQELFCARDPLGIKPFVYGSTLATFIFASEIKGLHALSVLEKTIDHERIPEFFAYKHIPAPNTIYTNIKKLPAGHFMCVQMRDGALRVGNTFSYWSPKTIEADTVAPDTFDSIRGAIRDSVEKHLVSDVPVGAFLSGGLDSSAIVWAMSQFTRPKTFTVSFKEIHDPDVEYARLVAKHFNTDHTEILLNLDVNSVFSSVICAFDEPFADPAVITNWYVAKATSGEVKVALSGDGGDELFFGYDSYRRMYDKARLRSLLPWWNPGRFIMERYFGYAPREQKRVLRHLSKPSFLFESVLEINDMRRAARTMDLQYTLPEYYLRKVDGVSMMNSLEVRVPFVTRTLVDMVVPFTTDSHYDAQDGKAILRRAMVGILPPAVLARRKQGFVRPWKELFAGSMRNMLRERVLSQAMADSGWFAMNTIEMMLLDHQEGRRDYSQMLWRLLVFAEWLEGNKKCRM